jgi:CMP-N-acetylneuraminic acid synthetase/GT2 family glycosyltransferase
MTKVSIVIRTKNEERWIETCLKGVFNQTYDNFEVIIIDNESTDKTIIKAESFPVKVLSLNNFTPGRAINLGVSESKGEIIVILSGHCIPVNNKWLENLISDLDEPDVAGVYGRQEPMSFSSDNDKRDLVTVFGLDKKIQIKDPFFHNANSAVRKKFLDNFPFDEDVTNVEDRVWGMEVIKNGFKIIYEPLASVYHYHGINHNMNPSRTRNVVRILESIGKENSNENPKYVSSFDSSSLKITAFIPSIGDLEMCEETPFIYYTIKRALEAKHVNRVVVLTDNKKTATICKKLGAEVPFLRPPKLSSPTSLIQDVLKYGVLQLLEMNYHTDLCVVLYKNYPFRTSSFIDDLIERFIREGADCMIPMKDEGRAIWKKSNEDVQTINPFMPRDLKKDQFLVSHFGLGFITHAQYIIDGSFGFDKKVYSYPLYDTLSSLEIRDKETISSVSMLLKKYMS